MWVTVDTPAETRSGLFSLVVGVSVAGITTPWPVFHRREPEWFLFLSYGTVHLPFKLGRASSLPAALLSAPRE